MIEYCGMILGQCCGHHGIGVSKVDTFACRAEMFMDRHAEISLSAICQSGAVTPASPTSAKHRDSNGDGMDQPRSIGLVAEVSSYFRSLASFYDSPMDCVLLGFQSQIF